MENTQTDYRSLVGFQEGARKIHVHVTELGPDASWQHQHTHKAEEVIYLLEGEAEFTFGGKTHRVGPGEAVFFPSEVLHAEATFFSDKTRYLVIRSIEPEEGPCCCGMDLPANETDNADDTTALGKTP